MKLTGESSYRVFLPRVDGYLEPQPVPTPTRLPPDMEFTVAIESTIYTGTGTLEPDEYVVIKNKSREPIQHLDWTLSDRDNHTITIPSFGIEFNQDCRIYTSQDHPEWCRFSFKSASSIWDNNGDCATLRDHTGKLIDEYCY